MGNMICVSKRDSDGIGGRTDIGDGSRCSEVMIRRSGVDIGGEQLVA